MTGRMWSYMSLTADGIDEKCTLSSGVDKIISDRIQHKSSEK
uniref:Uncharacterized protein n=1 Tax=Arundo donax TaxID=35708 RepID=A0A0A9FPJ2_ARUDO